MLIELHFERESYFSLFANISDIFYKISILLVMLNVVVLYFSSS
jgi:hypothetical protein